MHRPTVLLTYPIHRKVIAERLKPRARVLIARTRAEFERLAPQADAFVLRFKDPVDERLLKLCPKLKAIGNFAVGVDNIDLEACARRGIGVANTPDVLTRATAELALTLLLAAARRVPEGEAMCRAGRFAKIGGWAPDLLLGLELKGRRAVLVGRGRIGRETEKLFRGVGLKTEWITRQTPAREIAAKLGRAQVLSLHLPLNAQTRHWLDARRLGLLPRDAIVVNTTRGPVIDEKALIETLRKRRIYAAGLDVYEREPEIPKALRSLPNVVLLPHLGSATAEAREAMARAAIDGALALLNGKRPWNLVRWKPKR